jgi:hypothetical protein
VHRNPYTRKVSNREHERENEIVYNISLDKLTPFIRLTCRKKRLLLSPVGGAKPY